ncbi:MAG: SusF/SusE family outer membrane protein [Cyclobacteriaceae bacterium]|nr:SusF/SusE family outer membrane protein [Cyclobacteriaceae bacterium]
MLTNKSLIKIFSTALLALLILSVVSCEEDGEKVTLPDAETFAAPELLFEPGAPKVLLPEDDADLLYEIPWKNANYGINVSIRYEVEISDSEDFDGAVRTIAAIEGRGPGETRTARVTVKQMNDAMLALGLPAFTQHEIYFRVKSTVNGTTLEPLYSNVVSALITGYRISECGNFCSVGIIGSATPGGWSTDTDMRLLDPSGTDRSTWTVTIYLTGGQHVKFRAMDSWDTNWGSTAFPTGTGTQNGPDIPIPTSGYYNVTFNDETGAYRFVLITSSYSQIGIIGTGVGGWSDSNEKFLTRSGPTGAAAHIWTGTINFVAGEVKFRANASWSTNWGGTRYPSGYGINDGPNITIPTGGTYFVYFNSASGEYLIGSVANSAPYGTVGMIGPATPNGWGGPDTDLIKNPANPYRYSRVFTLVAGDLKFRADDSWTVNWGASSFPGGIGVQDGANIPAQAGTYFITFNSLTGEYYFLK